MLINLFFKSRTVYEIMWKNTVDPVEAADDNTAHAHLTLRSLYGPGFDSASNRNEYQAHFLGVKAAGA